MTNKHKFSPEETFNVLIAGEVPGEDQEALCMVIGYDLWDDKANTVMVNMVMPKGYCIKQLVTEEALIEMKIKGSKLYKSLK